MPDLRALDDEQLAVQRIDELIRDTNDALRPIEARSLGRILKCWREQIIAWH